MKRKKWISLWLALALMLCSFPAAVFASDMVFENADFENGLTGWTDRFGSGGIMSSAEYRYSGTRSVKIADTSTTSQYGLESNKQPATAGTTYLVYAKAYILSGSANLYIRFWDSADQVIDSKFTSSSTPNQWLTMKTVMKAPANTAYVTALLYSNKTNTGTVYWDDAAITKQFTNLGAQVMAAVPSGGTFGIGPNQHMLYSAISGGTGYDARMAAIDTDTETFELIGMGGAAGAWSAATATSGDVFFGSYNNGALFRYTPGGTSVTNLGTPVAGLSNIFALTSGQGGQVYGGGFADAKAFVYDPTTGSSEITPPIETAEDYVRSIAYDAARNVTYLGIGAHAKLIRYDNSTGARENILPTAYSSEEFVYSMDYVGGKLFARLSPSSKLLVLDVQQNASGAVTVTEDAVIEGVGSLSVSPVLGGKVYFTKAGELYAYDLAAKTNVSTGFSAGTLTRIGLVQLADQTNYPGMSVVGVGQYQGNTRLIKYNPQTGSNKKTILSVPELPQNLTVIGTGPDGNVYSAGFLGGGLGMYKPFLGDANDEAPDTIYRGIGQAESIQNLNGNMYIGVYPSSKVYRYDPSQPYSSGVNPVQLFSLDNDHQDRPVAMAAGGQYLFVGTVPGYGHLGGALTIYDTAGGGAPVVLRNIVPDQSVTALTYKNGKVYGGSSVRPGNGAVATQTEAKLFVYDTASATTATVSLPVSNLTAITKLIVGPDGNVWGMAEGYLFIYSVTTDSFTYFEQKFTDVSYPAGAWEDASLLLAKDGNVYGTIRNKYLFRIDPATKAITRLVTNGANGIAEDDYGNIYYYYTSQLKRYAF
ncbi:carbohydrate binding domain-containing protein [Paenibacillus ginsengarvi]|uniref:Uncharacterized protein n=1 Tax=Paenibacillus ginsengarvi TaxID=400777 RepID=A0A3B0CGI4_9BACL|nr:carbohydrate binding domain-containing protein [Paenibacillus ginsengarvi]RKN84945.1 hypothetical protein D7M11_10480 [Paenibacillus ginsengarvi]